MNELDQYPMTNQRRESYFRIIESESLIQTIAPRMYFLEDRFPPHKLDAALRWLIKNKKTGRVFLSWFNNECQNSDLEMHRLLLSIVENAALAPIIAGKNFKL